MKQPICAIFDKKTAIYSLPFVVRHNGDAIRDFETVKNDKQNPNNRYAKNPEDFDLFQIGEYDDEFGVCSTLKPHTHLMGGI